MKLLLIFLGGGAGSVLRYVVGLLCGPVSAGRFPLSTFVCNVVGCFLIGLLSGVSSRAGWSEEVRLMLTVGVCGGFTTFSTFTRESLALLQGGHPLLYAAYVGLSVVVGLAAVVCSVWLTR